MAFNYKKSLVIVVCLAALLVLAGSALGQSKPSGDVGAVAGPGPAGQNKEAGGSCSSYMGVTYNSRIYATIGFVGDQDYYRFYFSGGYLLAYTTGSTDTYGYLYTSSCSYVTYNDDGGTNTNFRIYTYRSSGYYYIRVHEFGNNGTGSYTLYLGNGASSYTESTSGSGGGSDAGSSCSSSMSVTYNSRIYGTISYNGDHDYYRFYFSGGYLLAYTTGSLDTYGYLYNSACSLVTYNNSGGSGYNFRIYTYRSSGYYYIRVFEYGNNATGSYTLYLGNGATSYTEGGTSSGGTGSGTDAGSSCSSYMSVTYNSRIYGSIGYTGDNDYYRFYFSGGYLLAYTTGTTDTYGYLYTTYCSLVTYNDDGGTGNNFRIYTYRSSGYYYVRVHEFGNNATGSYTLYLGNGATSYTEGGTSSGGTGSGTDAGSSCSSYMSVTYNSRIYGSIGYTGDNDYYRFYFSGGYLLAYTTGTTDTYGYLYTSSCSYVTYNDDGGTGNNFRIYTYRSSGYYYVRVHEFGNNATGSYTLYLGNGASSYTEGGTSSGTGAGTSCANASYISIGRGYSGSVAYSGENDYYRIYVSHTGYLTIYTTGTTDTYGYLLNSSCGSITYNDDGGSGLNFRIYRYVSPGTYYIRVRGFSTRTGPYTLYTSLS